MVSSSCHNSAEPVFQFADVAAEQCEYYFSCGTFDRRRPEDRLVIFGAGLLLAGFFG
jgi:hypothetical protein